MYLNNKLQTLIYNYTHKDLIYYLSINYYHLYLAYINHNINWNQFFSYDIIDLQDMVYNLKNNDYTNIYTFRHNTGIDYYTEFRDSLLTLQDDNHHAIEACIYLHHPQILKLLVFHPKTTSLSLYYNLYACIVNNKSEYADIILKNKNLDLSRHSNKIFKFSKQNKNVYNMLIKYHKQYN